MRKTLFLFMIALLGIAAEVKAGVLINATNFPDANFRNYVAECLDPDKDGYLTDAEIAAVTIIDAGGDPLSNHFISNFTGIEVFTALKTLWCCANHLTTLDVSKNTALTNLDCSGNQLTTLDVSKNTALTNLYCYNNQLTTLDLSKNTALTHLSCENNQLTALDLSKNTDMYALYCNNNQLTSLVISKEAPLMYLVFYCNSIRRKAMQTLVNGLYDRSWLLTGYIMCVCENETSEGNEMTTEQVAAARAKNWKVYTLDGLDYPGVASSTVTLNKSEAILQKSKTMTLKATVSSEIEDQSVTWKSSNTAVATVSSKGKVKGVKAGTATITCTSKATGESATCQVTVSYVKLDKTEAILEKGKTMTLASTVYPSKSTDQSVTWKSSNTVVATVTSKGKVKGVKAGTAVITCTSKATGLSTTCTVTVSYVKLDKTDAILEKGKTMKLTSTVYPSKSTDQSVTWKSSNTVVATVASDGTVKGVKAGTATITCTSVATGLSTTCQVTVSYVKLDKSKVTLEKGQTITLTPTVYPSKSTDQSVTWKSSNTKVATVTSAGKVKGIKAGTVTITCTSVAKGLSTTCKVTVTASASARTIDGDDTELTDIDMLEETPAVVEPFDVYDLKGHRVLHQVTSLNGLPTGVYIVNGKKMLKK